MYLTTKNLRAMALKSSVIRNAYCSFQLPLARPGSRVRGLSLRCPPVGPAFSRLTLRTASATTSCDTKPDLVVDFGKGSRNDGGFEYDTSAR